MARPSAATAALLAALAASAPAQAQAQSQAQAQAQAPAQAQPAPPNPRREAADRELHHRRLLEVFPALAPVDQAVRDDCAARAPGQAAAGRFCKCAVAVVFGRWRDNLDPPVLKGLQEVALKSAPRQPAEFVAAQGPQDYAALCTAAGRR